MKTYNELLINATDELESADVPEPELNAWYLLAWSVAISREERPDDESETRKDEDESEFVIRLSRSMPDRAWYMMHAEDEADESVTQTLERLIEYRKKRVPLEYITHYTEFMGLPFYVDPSVLIPRQDTECVVEAALDILKKDHAEKSADVLDMCTGSGCIAISLAKHGGLKSVAATDKSKEALKVAKTNAEVNGVDISFFQGDLWEAVEKSPQKYDIVISNPPYIKHDVMSELMDEVRDYEPVMALDGGEDGLLFYRSITLRIGEFLRQGGSLIFEIGYDQGKSVAELMRESGFADIEVRKDYCGCDRIVTGRFSG